MTPTSSAERQAEDAQACTFLNVIVLLKLPSCEDADCTLCYAPGGKNFHLVHKSADVRMSVIETIRAAFEYQG